MGKKSSNRVNMPYKNIEDARRNSREHYARNKEKYLERNRKSRLIQREFLNTLKDKPCMDCGLQYPPYVMDFDHRDPSTKLGHVGTLVSETRISMKRLLAEIEKCDLVCANCHRIRTHDRLRSSLIGGAGDFGSPGSRFEA